MWQNEMSIVAYVESFLHRYDNTLHSPLSSWIKNDVACVVICNIQGISWPFLVPKPREHSASKHFHKFQYYYLSGNKWQFNKLKAVMPKLTAEERSFVKRYAVTETTRRGKSEQNFADKIRHPTKFQDE